MWKRVSKTAFYNDTTEGTRNNMLYFSVSMPLPYIYTCIYALQVLYELLLY